MTQAASTQREQVLASLRGDPSAIMERPSPLWGPQNSGRGGKDSFGPEKVGNSPSQWQWELSEAVFVFLSLHVFLP